MARSGLDFVRPGCTTALVGALCLLALAPSVAQARTRTSVVPYLEVDQTVIGDLQGGSGDVLTYSSVAVGVDANVRTARTEAQIDLRYEHQFGWGSSLNDTDVISGIGTARYHVIPGMLTIETGGLATRLRSDGGALGNSGPAVAGSTSKIYSAYIGPDLSTQLGDIDVNLGYRLGYARVDDNILPAFNSADESVYNAVTASAGMRAGGGVLPFGWVVSAGYERDDGNAVGQVYEDKWGRADVTVPLTASLAAVGGVGYEAVKISQYSAVAGPGGTIVLDKSVPRQIAYDSDGLIGDVGVLWRPSRRTTVEARAGWRYDDWHFIGMASWRPSDHESLSLAYFDTIDTLGRSLTRRLGSLSTSFTARRNPFSGDLTGCVAGSEGGGACLNDMLTALSGASFRSRGVVFQYDATRGVWSYGAGAGYSQRRFITAPTGIFAGATGSDDENYWAEGFVGRRLDRSSNIEFSVYGNHFNSQVIGDDLTNIGGYATYSRVFGGRLSANASIGIDSIKPEALQSVVSALGQVGMRYQF